MSPSEVGAGWLEEVAESPSAPSAGPYFPSSAAMSCWTVSPGADAVEAAVETKDLALAGEQAEAVGLLGLVAGQDVEPGERDGTFRIARKVAPDRVISVVDPQARHMHKSVSSYRDGYKAHVAVEPETGLVTACKLTPANAGDGPTGVELLAGEDPGLQVLADSAYGSGEVRVAIRKARH